MMAQPACPFCDKVAGISSLAPDELVWEFRHGVALLGPWQYYEGYCILVSKMHATELSQLSPSDRAAFLQELCVLARAIEEAFRPHKLNYELLGNEVPHLHWHVFPRYLHDAERLKPVWLALDRAERDESEGHRLRTGSRTRGEIADAIRFRLEHGRHDV
jgi:diadenosine tetraphosphate (Ap4A) HIT family hydrolase